MTIQPPQSTLVKAEVANVETRVKRLGQESTEGPMMFRISAIDDGDSADWH
jgi:hypothetical protein